MTATPPRAPAASSRHPTSSLSALQADGGWSLHCLHCCSWWGGSGQGGEGGGDRQSDSALAVAGERAGAPPPLPASPPPAPQRPTLTPLAQAACFPGGGGRPRPPLAPWGGGPAPAAAAGGVRPTTPPRPAGCVRARGRGGAGTQRGEGGGRARGFAAPHPPARLPTRMRARALARTLDWVDPHSPPPPPIPAAAAAAAAAALAAHGGRRAGWEGRRQARGGMHARTHAGGWAGAGARAVERGQARPRTLLAYTPPSPSLCGWSVMPALFPLANTVPLLQSHLPVHRSA